MPAECPLLFIGQCDFDLCFLDTILHWGHLSLYCDPALVCVGFLILNYVHIKVAVCCVVSVSVSVPL